jgi:hypothetical protein
MRHVVFLWSLNAGMLEMSPEPSHGVLNRKVIACTQMEYVILENYSSFCTTGKRIINKYCHRNTQAPNEYGV